MVESVELCGTQLLIDAEGVLARVENRENLLILGGSEFGSQGWNVNLSDRLEFDPLKLSEKRFVRRDDLAGRSVELRKVVGVFKGGLGRGAEDYGDSVVFGQGCDGVESGAEQLGGKGLYFVKDEYAAGDAV